MGGSLVAFLKKNFNYGSISMRINHLPKPGVERGPEVFLPSELSTVNRQLPALLAQSPEGSAADRRFRPCRKGPIFHQLRITSHDFSVCYDFAMTARILDGTKIRDQIFAELSDEVRLLTAAGVRPGLAAVLVGENPASQLYVKSKIAACEQLGLSSALLTPPATVTTLELLAVIEDLNRDNDVDGILVQLPLPPQVDTKRILEAVDPAKDVDGFHPVNLGRLVSGRPGLVACTPAGCMEILRRNEIKIEGANAVVLGRSDIVGKPMALLLMHANATVTICHSKTRDLPEVLRRADIVVASMGKAGYVEADWIKPGAAVIDVGTNRVTDPKEAERLFHDFPDRLEKFRAKGSALVGDVHPRAVNIAGALTPVPGGVGPMTITMLMSNTVKAARLRRASPKFSATQSTATVR